MKWQLRRFLKLHPQLRIVAVTGSVGKTVTKLAIAQVLAKKYKVQAHPGSYNTETGVPLSIFGLESPGSILNLKAWLKIIWQIEKQVRKPYAYEIIVQELGARRVGEIRHFEYLRPEIGVVVAAKPAHLEGFGSIENIVNEKFELARYSQIAVVDAEDKRLAGKFKELPPEKLKTYGLKRGDYTFKEKSFNSQKGFSGQINMPDADSFKVNLRLSARHNVRSAVAAAAVGNLLGVSNADIKYALEALRPVSGRMNPLPGKNGSLIIDDSYNASPEAVLAALETLESMPGRKIAILGGMNELGPDSVKYHEKIGKALGKIDMLVTVAQFALDYVEPAKAAGLKDSQIVSFDSPYEAGEYVAGLVKKGDTILVKGSQGGIFNEEATAKLLLNSSDKQKLVRQSDFWRSVKNKTFQKHQPTHED